MPTVSKKTAVIGITTIVLLSAVTIGVVMFINRNKVHDEVTAQGFSGIIAKAKRKHPQVYAWWDSLHPDQQISIESTLTPELLTHLSQDFAKSKLSPQTMELLTRAGY